MSKAAKISFRQFRDKFASEDACSDYLFQERFPDGFCCPKCGGHEYYPIRKRKLCQCKSCRHQTSVTSGTIMHRTHLPLTTWFWAIFLCATDKRGISAAALAGKLEIAYESAWYLLMRIRSAMKNRDQNYHLSGLIEMDEAYLGGPKAGGKRGRGTTQQKMIVGLSKTDEGNPKYLRFQQIPDVTTDTLQKFIDEYVEPKSSIECDGFSSYKGLKNVTCIAKKYSRGDLKRIHIGISNFKTFLVGTYHGRCQCYQAYMNKFCFRFNRRFSPEQLFSRLARAVATSCVLLS